MSNSLVNLAPEHLDIVLNILKKYIPNTTVAVFGSRVRGNAKPTSDIDLVIMGDTRLPKNILASLQEAFTESSLPMKVDIVEWATTSESFRKIITEKNVEIQ